MSAGAAARSSPWWWASSSAAKKVLAMEAAVGGGGGVISSIASDGELPKGERRAEGDMRWTELARRGGATPLAECSEFSEALRSSVGVAERESRPPLRGLRGPPRLLATLGERLMVVEEVLGLAGDGRGEERGDLTGEERERESCLRECDRSAWSLLRLFADDPLRRGDEALEDGAAIVEGPDGSGSESTAVSSVSSVTSVTSVSSARETSPCKARRGWPCLRLPGAADGMRSPYSVRAEPRRVGR